MEDEFRAKTKELIADNEETIRYLLESGEATVVAEQMIVALRKQNERLMNQITP